MFQAFLPYLGAVLTTVIGLGMWQYQLITKRRYEIVEHALTIAGEAAHALHYIRQAEAGVLAVIQMHPQDPHPELWFTSQGRIQESAPTFQELEAVAKSIAMHFGEDAAQSFIELWAFYTKMGEAQMGLYFRSDAGKVYPTDEQTEQLGMWEKTLNAQDQDDTMTREINETEKRIEAGFTKYLRPSLWRLRGCLLLMLNRKCQYLRPSAVTQRKRPPPSAIPYGLAAGLAVWTSRAVSSMASTLFELELSMY